MGIQNRHSNLIGYLFALLLSCAVNGNASATSHCYEWQTSYFGYPGSGTTATVSGYQTNIDGPCGIALAAIEANPDGQGINSTNYNHRNWSYQATMTSAAFPNWSCSIFYEYQARYSWMCGNQMPCPWFSSSQVVGTSFNDDGCKVYISALLDAQAQCGPTCNGVGHPINPVSGSVYDVLVDAPLTSDAELFKRFYNSTDTSVSDTSQGWRHSFSRTLAPVYSGSLNRPYSVRAENSSLYSEESAACISGFAEIKSRVSTWANASATYSSNTCIITAGTSSVATLPILYTAKPTPAPGSVILIGYDVTRDDGQLIRFTVNGGVITAPAGINLKLSQVSSGYAMTDADDNVEIYDVNGKLLSVTNRVGMVQTMNYDTEGRLSTIVDNFGHQVTMSYDAAGRVSSVASQ